MMLLTSSSMDHGSTSNNSFLSTSKRKRRSHGFAFGMISPSGKMLENMVVFRRLVSASDQQCRGGSTHGNQRIVSSQWQCKDGGKVVSSKRIDFTRFGKAILGHKVVSNGSNAFVSNRIQRTQLVFQLLNTGFGFGF
ncbi:hypothetical protein OGAPHI_004754 [Ogataea philodendri]|uniref:Uncharacterized protein n=1 Tax=Ogataea philodendri TaxID=1378263 RepID=A0A9P8T3I5_9ASCO|nr:uncharacterized protein OGAPHI_004754 [Ogataea philodendri]KAH3664040.1 hypothetical protein OGAPHI_004754 [Ogataea philodendri]